MTFLLLTAFFFRPPFPGSSLPLAVTSSSTETDPDLTADIPSIEELPVLAVVARLLDTCFQVLDIGSCAVSGHPIWKKGKFRVDGGSNKMRRYYPGWTINKRWSSSNVKMLSVRVIRRILTNDYVAMRWLAHLAKVIWQASDAIVYMYDVTTH